MGSREMSGIEPVFAGFRKRDGMVVPFRRQKIENAIRRAAEAVARDEGKQASLAVPVHVTDRVIEQLNDAASEYYVYPDDDGQRIPDIEDVQDLVEILLAEQRRDAGRGRLQALPQAARAGAPAHPRARTVTRRTRWT